MAETKTAKAAGKGRSSEIVEGLLAKGKKNGGTLTYGELIDALQMQLGIAQSKAVHFF